MTGNETIFQYNLIKGRIAEALIEGLFTSSGFDVYRFGIENTLPSLVHDIKGENSSIAKELRRMPDFVVKCTSSGKLFYLEVKYRQDGFFSMKHVGKDYPYTETYFIVLSQGFIKCISYKELKNGKEIKRDNNFYLGNRKEFGLDSKLVVQFCRFSDDFYESVEKIPV